MQCAMVHPDAYRLERDEGGDVGLLMLHTRTFTRGQAVIANGRFGMPPGSRGVIEWLVEPFTEGRTTNVIGIRFEGLGHLVWMKPEDLMFEEVPCA